MKFILAALILTFSATAFSAGAWTPAKKISQIEEYGSGIKVYGLDLSSNPAKCQENYVALPNPTQEPDKINRLNSMLLAAYMAGKSVELKLSGTACSSNLPTYFAVRVSN